MFKKGMIQSKIYIGSTFAMAREDNAWTIAM